MKVLHFRRKDFKIIDEALEIAEDLTANFYKFSTSEWKKRHRYDIRTLLSLKKYQVTDKAFAVLYKDIIKDFYMVPHQLKDVYLICLQDHLILKAILKDRHLSLLPLLVYIFTHELVHIVRFCNFYIQFNAAQHLRKKEEHIVNSITFDILNPIMIPKLNYVLELYGKEPNS